MTPEKLAELTEQELMQEEKKQKSGVIAFRVILGLLMGVAFWSATHKGSFIISCLPLFFMGLFVAAEKNYKAVQSEIEARKSI
jgi:hypothetical protein